MSPQVLTIMFVGDARGGGIDDDLLVLLTEPGTSILGEPGGGLFVTYAGATGALNAAIELQSAAAARPGSGGPQLRIGAHVSEVADGCDLRTTLAGQTARALSDSAEPGEIRVSGLVRDLVASRKQHEFEAADPVAVADAAQPIASYRLVWERPALGTLATVPAALGTTGSLVGRAAQVEALTAAWHRCTDGAQHVAFIGGPAGVGKTRLAAEAATVAVAAGGIVLYGRCDEDLGAPYQPFAEALDAYVQACPPEMLYEQLGPTASDLHPLLPRLPAHLPELAEPQGTNPEAARSLMFDAAARLLAAAAATRPVLLVVDDLHWAPRPTVLLLDHLLRIETARLMIVATYRDDELGASHPLRDLLRHLPRDAGHTRIALRGLDEGGVTAFVAAAAGHELDERATALARALHDLTGGNPFFMGEVLTHLVDSGAVYQVEGRWTADPSVTVDDLGLPESVTDVIGRRLSRLGDPTRVALTAAAVVGAVFDAALLTEVVGVVGDSDDAQIDAVSGALEEAAAAGVLVPVPGSATPTYTFTHALFRQTLLAELSAARRMRLHRRIGEAIERLPDADQHVGALAHHFAESVGGTGVAKAVDYALAAAGRALEQLAVEDAIAYLERGLQLIDLEPVTDLQRRADLHIALAEALDWKGDIVRVETAVRAAARDARTIGSAAQLVRGAHLIARYTRFGDEEAAAALSREALAAVQEGETALRARALGVFLMSQASSRSRSADFMELADDALDLARQCQDDAALGTVLQALGLILSGTHQAERLVQVGNELVPLGQRMRDPWSAGSGLRFLAQGRLQLGDAAGCDEALAELHSLGVDRRHVVSAGWWAAWSGTRLLMAGRLDDVEAATHAIIAEGRDGDPNYVNAYAAQLFALRREQGRLDELLPLLTGTVADNPGIPAFRTVLAIAEIDCGHFDDARDHFERLKTDGFASVPRDLSWAASLSLLSELAAALDDVPAAAVLTELLMPFSGQLMIAATGVACLGAADRFLGMLAATLGKEADAATFYGAALELEERVGAPLLAARTRACRDRLPGE